LHWDSKTKIRVAYGRLANSDGRTSVITTERDSAFGMHLTQTSGSIDIRNFVPENGWVALAYFEGCRLSACSGGVHHF
jgi:hypothetical protein